MALPTDGALSSESEDAEAPQENLPKPGGRFPSWLHRPLPRGGNLWATDRILADHCVATVCEQARCPNQLECWTRKTATFLVMGSHCTRKCAFCHVEFSPTPPPLDDAEPQRVAEAVKKLGLRHAVLTMVTRDDLSDGGAHHLAQCLFCIRQLNPGSSVEVLSSDLEGKKESLDVVLRAHPEVFNHNVETVRRLTPHIRCKASYERSLEVLRYAKQNGHPSTRVKSGIMVGLGESREEVHETLNDLHRVGCDIVTIGQYLQPSRYQLRVKAFLAPQQFKAYEEVGKALGIPQMICGPLVRSSYHAEDGIEAFKEGEYNGSASV